MFSSYLWIPFTDISENMKPVESFSLYGKLKYSLDFGGHILSYMYTFR